VKKVFRIFDTGELLYAENLSFDNKPRLYSNVPELETLSVFAEGYLPGRNNLKSATVHDDYPGYPKVSPYVVTYALDYDQGGMITASDLQGQFMFGTFHFSDAAYSCE
jgi:hypothetical protein